MSSNYPYIFGPKKENSIEKTVSAERLKGIREQIDQYRRQDSKPSKTADTAFDNSINQQSSNRKETDRWKYLTLAEIEASPEYQGRYKAAKETQAQEPPVISLEMFDFFFWYWEQQRECKEYYDKMFANFVDVKDIVLGEKVYWDSKPGEYYAVSDPYGATRLENRADKGE